MAQSLTPLAPTTAAARSADIVVTAAPTTIFVYTADGKFPSDFQIPLQRKVGANYQAAAGPENSVFFTGDRLEWTAYAVGTYSVPKGVTAYAIGVGVDTP